MILDILLASAAALVNIFVLYTLYTQQGFPSMFNSMPGLVSAGLTAASTTYLIIAILSSRRENIEEDDEDEILTHEETGEGFTTVLRSPQPIHVGPNLRRHDGGDGDLLARAVARAIENADLKGDIGFHIAIPEHEISIGGHKASIRGQMVLETQPPAAKKEESETTALILREPPSGNPIEDFIKRKLAERGVS